METTAPTDQLRPQVLLFDVYETLLDMELIERKANAILNSKRGYTLWFEMFMQYCFVDNSLKRHNPFSSIAKATLQMTGRTLGITVTEDQSEEIVELLNHLPLKENVTEVLSHFYDQGFRIAALTNASKDIIESRMERTGLISYFEEVISAEEVNKYKPALEVYQLAASRLNVQPYEILFISSHSWDIAGADNAGMRTVYLNQDKQMLYPLAPIPTIESRDLDELVDKINLLYMPT